MRYTRNRGVGLVEVIIALSVVIMVVTGVLATYPLLLRTGLGTLEKAQAALLLEEGVEAVKVLRDGSWSANIARLSVDTSYRLAFATSTWLATTTVTLVDSIFDRTFELENAYRDSNDDLTETPGTLDSKTRKLTVTVAWLGSAGTTTRSLSTYITDLFSN